MKKTFKVKLILAIILIVPVVVSSILIKNFVHKLNIAKSGTLATATVIDYYSNTYINDEPIYYLIYSFEDENSIQHTGRTESKYTIFQAESIFDIDIKYNKQFESVPADFCFVFSDNILLIIMVAFSIADLILWIIFLIDIKKMIDESSALKYGVEKQATFLSFKCGEVINGIEYYSISYKFKNDYGVEIVNKTKNIYKRKEAQCFANLKTFKIKQFKNKSCICEDIKLAKIVDCLENEQNNESDEFFVKNFNNESSKVNNSYDCNNEIVKDEINHKEINEKKLNLNDDSLINLNSLSEIKDYADNNSLNKDNNESILNNKFKICSMCGAKTKFSDKFCSQCGSKKFDK